MTAPPSTASVRARPLSVHIHTSIDIHADADAVWTVMADTAAYATGARSSAASTASLPSATGSASRCNWTATDRKRSGPASSTSIPAAASHPGGRTVTHSERLRGLLVPGVRGLLTGPTPNAFIAHNEALKNRVGRVGK